MEEEKGRETTKRARKGERERERGIQEDYVEGVAPLRETKVEEYGGGETRMEKERKDVKQSNDEMHFPPRVHPPRPPSRSLGVHPEGNVERNVKNREEE